MPVTPTDKSLENWIWDAACSIRGAKDAWKYKNYTLSALFRTLLHQLMTAQLRVHDLDLDRLLARAE